MLIAANFFLAEKYLPYFANRKNAQAAKYIIRRGDASTNMLAITFDSHTESVNPEAALKILDYLKEKNVKCTFFLTGAFIEKYPDITRRIAEDGHEVGSHLYTHTHADDLSNKQFKDELFSSADLYYKTTGKKMAPYWRAPGSNKYKTKVALAHKLGYDYIGVTFYYTGGLNYVDLDSYDWVQDKNDNRYMSSEEIVAHVLTPLNKKGGIMLFHLEIRKEDSPYNRFPEIIDGLRKQGYQLVAVSELLKK